MNTDAVKKALVLAGVLLVAAGRVAAQDPYVVVDTGQTACYGNQGAIVAPSSAQPFFGQDAQYAGRQPVYRDNGNGTVTDLNTGLTWQQSPDRNGDGRIDSADKLDWNGAQAYPQTLNALQFGGASDWRLPTIKELYSLIDFRGTDPSGAIGNDTSRLVPFIDRTYFPFGWGDTNAGERVIDAQYWSATRYVGTRSGALVFGVNFADGRIKGYGLIGSSGRNFTQYVKCVRGATAYGVNRFLDNGDGTVTDAATGLQWQREDSGRGMLWQSALAYAEGLQLAGYSDWRLPNAKELQSIVDYTRSPSSTGTAAIDPCFRCTTIFDEVGRVNFPFFWTGTTHASSNQMGAAAVYICFGEGLGWLTGPTGVRQLIDIHGAGAQRSDPKSGNPADYPYGRGPQGDVIRIYNFVRCVRTAPGAVPPRHDLALSRLTATPPAVRAGSVVTFAWSVKNLGNTAEPNLTVRLLRDGKLAALPKTVSALAPGQEVLGTFTLALPVTIAAGTCPFVCEVVAVAGEAAVADNRKTVVLTVTAAAARR